MTTSFLQPARRQGNKFLNPVPTVVSPPGTLWPTLRDFLTGSQERVPLRPPPAFAAYPTAYGSPPATGLSVTWLGHSTYLLEIDGGRLLLDPVWATYASPVALGFGMRFFPNPLPLDQLPALTAVVISHDHYDHFDPAALRRISELQPEVPFICPLGVGARLRKAGVAPARIQELDWTQATTLGPATAPLTLTALPARHFSGRGLFDRDRTLWASYAVVGPRHRVYCGGDSGFWPGFAEIGEQLGPFDLTILEIGAYGPYWPDIHLGPANAVQAHRALRGRVLFPVHWGTFNLAYHAWREPVEWVVREAAAHGVTLLLPRPGEPMEVTPVGQYDPWWEE